MSEKRRYRCAIYTRKSHEEGLDQAFNSLDAQRESCEAYILSQAGLGWELIDRSYDDGGISGGHMERDGLQHLLTDIKAGQVDVVVVYKVDRLTRSIIDFGKLVEAFDEHEVSFVSVTQAFNTTNSMGRLTLNVLLSFAQFEREVTAERIRDKIASSKKKGMWMGARVPFGYRNEDKQLIIYPNEANSVKLMFDLYLEHENIREVKEALDRQCIQTRQRTSKSGRVTGGEPFSRGNISSILTNPIYAGKIRHKDKVYKGNHEAIISLEQWEQVQSLIAERQVKRTTKRQSSSPALLKGLLFDQDNRLIPHHANKKGKKYHYYVSQFDNEHAANKPSLRFPIGKLDAIIQTIVLETLECRLSLLECLNLQKQSADRILAISNQSKLLANGLKDSNFDETRTTYQQIISKIIIKPDCIVIELDAKGMQKHLGVELKRDAPLQIIESMTIRRRGQELKLVIGGIKQNDQNMDQSIIRMIAQAHSIRTQLEKGSVSSIKEYAELHKTDQSDAKKLLALSYLAPSIIEDILAGHQPVDLTARRLKDAAYQLPVNWSDQRQYLGFNN